MRIFQQILTGLITIVMIFSVQMGDLNQSINLSNKLAIAQVVSGAIAFDATSSGACISSCASNAAATTFSHAVTSSGSNKILLVGVVQTNNSADPVPPVSSVTYNGVPMTSLLSITPSQVNATRVEVFYITNPSSGTGNVVVSTGSGTIKKLVAGAISFTGVNQSSPFRGNSSNAGSGTSASVSIPSASGDLVIDFACNGTSLSSASQTQRLIRNVDTNVQCNNLGISTAAGASSVTTSWVGGNDYWIDFALSLIPSTATPPPTGDTTPPSVPSGLSASAISSSQINLSWTASADNVGVTGYDIYRGGTFLTSVTTNSYSNTGLTASTQYTYTVRAKDAAGNVSTQSSSANATTATAGTGNTITAASCSQSAVQAAINSSVSGDRVIIPACAATSWTSGINIPSSKAIEVTGSGIGITNITSNYSGTLVQINISTGGSGVTLFGNMTINANNTSSYVISVDGGSGQNRFRVHHVKIDNLSGRGVTVQASGTADFSGLVDHNQITSTGNSHLVEPLGAEACNNPTPSSDPCNNAFTTSPTLYFGTSNMIFFEDNILTSTTGNLDDGALDAYGGAKFVFRHNTVVNSWLGVHGADSGPYRGIHSFEIYANTWTNNLSAIARLFFFRSGSGPIYDNVITGPYNGKELVIYRDPSVNGTGSGNFQGPCNGSSPWDGNTPGRAGWPCLDQSGYIFGHNQGSGFVRAPVYFWNNVQNGSLISIGSDSPNYQQSGVEYVNSASRPSGTNDYLATYTSYTYPHPLQGGSIPPPTDTTAPSVPTNLSATAVSSSQINLSWTSSTDNTTVTGYKIFRAGSQIGTSATNSYSNTGLSPSTLYSYTVSAYDAAGNNSGQSSSVSATTQATGAVATYYVNNSGSPACSNSPSFGSITQPWCTISYGIGRMGGGNRLYVRSGTYNETLYINGPSGTANRPTIIQVYPGDAVTLRGSGIDSGRNKIENASHIIFDGFEITNYNQGLFVDSSNNITVQNVNIHHVGQEGLGVHFDSSFITIQNSTVHDTRQWQYNGEGIYIGTSSSGPRDNTNNVIVQNNIIYNTNDEGIELKPGTHDITVDGNTLYNVMGDSSYSAGGGAIEVNEATISCPSCVGGIQTWGSNPNHIIKNNVVRSSKTAIRMGTGGSVYNNIIYNTISPYYGILVNNNAGDSYVRKIYHNTIDIPSSRALVNQVGGLADIRNNIGPATSGNVATNNNYYENKVSGNYRLIGGSAPVNAGSNVGISVDIDDNTRPNGAGYDFGAYEYSGGGIPTPTPTPVSKQPFKFRLSSMEGKAALPSNQSLTITVINPSNSAVLSTQTLTPVAGEYTVNFNTSDPTTVNIRVKANNYLSRLVSNINTTITNTTYQYSSLLSGDLNNDNTINTLDFSVMNTVWNTNNPTSDINGDSIVNTLDFALLSKNWNLVGE